MAGAVAPGAFGPRCELVLDAADAAVLVAGKPAQLLLLLRDAAGVPWTGDALLARLRGLEDHPNVGDVRGRGLLLGIELVEEKAGKTPLGAAGVVAVVGRCARDGVIIGKTTSTTPGYGNVVILAPPLVLNEDESDLLVTTVERAIREELPTSS